MSINLQRALGHIREGNKHFAPGTEVDWQGELRKTWGPAGLGYKNEPSVWLEGVEELVPLNSLTVPGWERKRRR